MQRFAALLFALLSFVCSYGQQNNRELKLLGHYSWEKTTTISPEKLEVTTTVKPTKQNFYKRKENKPFVRKLNIQKKVLSRKTFIEPPKNPVRFTGRPIRESDVIKTTPFLFKDHSGFNVTYSDKSHGFPANSTVAVAEDENKNIWIATGDIGLIKYDGINYYIYNTKSGLPSNNISDVAYDFENNRLWIATSMGIAFIKNDELFFPDSASGLNEKSDALKIYIDAQKNTWFGTKNMGALKFSESSFQVYDSLVGLPSNYVTNVFVDKKDNAWFGIYQAGAVKISLSEIIQLSYEQTDDNSHKGFFSFYEDTAYLWIGSFALGLIRISEQDTLQYSLSAKFNERIYSIADAPGGLFFTIYGTGLCYFSPEKYFLITEMNGLSARHSYYSFHDSYGNLWVTDLFGGISRLNESPLNIDYSFPEYFSKCVNAHADKNGNKWYFMNGSSLMRDSLDGFVSNYNEDGYSRYYIDGVLNDDGSLYISTYGNGMCIANEKTHTFLKYGKINEENVSISVEKDAHNRVWLGTMFFGAVYYENGNFFHLSVRNGLLDKGINTLGTDNEGNILLGFESGIQKITNTELFTLQLNGTPFQIPISCFYITKEGTQLIGTSGNGLLIFSEDKIYSLGKSNGLESDAVYSIIEDENKNLWLATGTGIARVNFVSTATVTLKVYDLSYGINLGNINTAVFLNEQGNPCWSVGGGILCFNPLFEKDSFPAPVINFKSATVNNDSVGVNEVISVYSNDDAEIKYSFIFWGREKNTRLNYLLVSDNKKDTSFFPVGEPGILKLTELNEGKYTLLIRADCENKNYFSSPLKVVVSPFWYNSTWFRTLIAFLIIASIILYFRIKVGRAEKRKAELEKIISEKTSELVVEKLELQKQNITIAKQNLEKDALIQEIHHRVKNNLQTISSMIALQADSIKNKAESTAVANIHRRITAMSIVHEMLYKKTDVEAISISEYLHALVLSIDEMVNTQKLVIAFRVEVDELFMNISDCISIGMIVSEAISNSIKHAFPEVKKPEIKLHLAANHNEVELIISDNGKGFDAGKKEMETFGIRLIDIFTAQLKGNFSFETSFGTNLKIIFPLKT